MNKVSIIVPNFNGSLFLKETIESVVNQSYKNWELIVVDDGSTDNSASIVSSYLSEKVRYIQRSYDRKKGGNTCRNIGIEEATGDYAIFLDSDDILADYCLEQRIAFMERHKELDFAVFNIYNFVGGDISTAQLHTHLNVPDPEKHFMGLNCLWQTTSPIWNINFIRNLKFNEDFLRLQDPELTLRALNTNGVKYELVKDSIPDTYYRLVVNNKSKVNKKRKVTANYNIPFSQFVQEFYSHLGEESPYDIPKKSLFLQITQHHLLAADSENIKRYRQTVNTLRLKKNVMYTFIYQLSQTVVFLVLMRNRLSRKLCTIYFRYSLKRLWGADCVVC